MRKLYVGNLAWTATEEEVKELFGKHGTVTSVRIIKDRDTGKSRGFCFVEMEDATAAATALNGFDLKGRQLRVNEAQEQQPRGNRGGTLPSLPGDFRGGADRGGDRNDRGYGRGDDRGNRYNERR